VIQDANFSTKDFIRDPDDPTFHPVRDVLERNIATQLRKIAFSALVYGALVIFCPGGVVWGLAFAFDGVLPIHWSSNEPVLEFPVDLLFYNFVMPLAIRWIRPSDGLQEMYDWWFHRCARFLRLTNFMFGDRWLDEEGRHVRMTWRALLSLRQGDTANPVIRDGDTESEQEKERDAYFLRDGKFVRTPASDQVRIPKGGQVFVEVDENNERIDGNPDQDDGLHGKTSEMFTKVYIPPFFRFRICLFIFLIWAFAATTGVGTTIVPLVIGRRMISSLFPSHLRVNDIYAFSAGIYVFGGICYTIFHCQRSWESMQLRIRPYIDEPRRAIPEAYAMAIHFLRLVYISATFSLLLPSLFALVMELYVLVPLHTYLGGGQEHVIYFVQDWTLGVLYVRMAVKFILWNSTSRPAIALNAITRNGWLNPDVKLATRAFIVPAISLALLAIISPLPLGFLANTIFFRGAASDIHSNVYRYSYPGTFVLAVTLWTFYLLRRQMAVWRVSIRDDVYLVGERLHNFGEKRAKDMGQARRMITS
jgi:E3 ubiquitin-protein ligase MARCH6